MPRPRGTVVLERALSKLGLTSRRAARELIEAGRVTVDGETVRDPSRAVVPEAVDLRIDGRRQRRPAPFTLLLHKPRGVVTTRRDPQGRPTVYDCLSGLAVHVVPIGRLDFASSGLLLLTNDTRLADWLTDPVNAVPRTYVVTVRGALSDDEVARARAGLEAGGEALRAVGLEVRKRSRRETHLVVTLEEGKNREIRRLFAALGRAVTRLKRVGFGGLGLGDLPPGAWRELGPAELHEVFPDAPLGRGPLHVDVRRDAP